MSVITLTIRYPAGDRFVRCAQHVSLRSKLHHCLRWSWIRHRTLDHSRFRTQSFQGDPADVRPSGYGSSVRTQSCQHWFANSITVPIHAHGTIGSVRIGCHAITFAPELLPPSLLSC